MNKEATQSKELKEQIAKWKKEHGKVFQLTTGKESCYIRKPDFNEVDYATAMSVNSPLSFPKEIITQCFLGGDERFKTEIGFVMGVSAQIDQIVETVVVEVKEV